MSRAFDSGVERKQRRLTVDRLSGVVDYCAVEGVCQWSGVTVQRCISMKCCASG